jgi:transcription elongation factor Elf1
MSQAAVCNHTVHHDTPGATWHLTKQNGTAVVVCRVCGKLYGYVRSGQQPAKEER